MSEEVPLGQQIDALYDLRARRLEKQKEVEELKSQEENCKVAVLQRLEAQGLWRGTGLIATASVIQKTFPVLKDWESFTAWVRETGSFDLLERRVAKTAFRECLEAGTYVPGVEAAVDVDLSLVRSQR